MFGILSDIVAMGAAGRLGILLCFWCCVFVFFLFLFDDGVGGGVGWGGVGR